jgi:hypothetical protein
MIEIVQMLFISFMAGMVCCGLVCCAWFMGAMMVSFWKIYCRPGNEKNEISTNQKN